VICGDRGPAGAVEEVGRLRQAGGGASSYFVGLRRGFQGRERREKRLVAWYELGMRMVAQLPGRPQHGPEGAASTHVCPGSPARAILDVLQSGALGIAILEYLNS